MTESPWAPATTRRDTRRSRRGPGRSIEVVTVLLLALATVGSAWSAYQVSRWNGTETDEARVSASLRIDASRQYALATQTVSYDAAAISQYAAAVAADDEDLQRFLREALIRPGFRPLFDSWVAQVEAGEIPTNLLEDREYLDDLLADSVASDTAALEAAARAEEAGRNADDYIQLTLFFAGALFFAGVTASFSTRPARFALLGASTVVLATAAVLLAGYPIA